MSDFPSPIDRARDFRRNMTPEESLLWINLRNRKFRQLKFLRQHPIIYEIIGSRRLFYIADFYCAEKKLIIKIDGIIHEFQKDYDERRDEILAGMDLKVLRIKNKELKDVHKVLDKIARFIEGS